MNIGEKNTTPTWGVGVFYTTHSQLEIQNGSELFFQCSVFFNIKVIISSSDETSPRIMFTKHST